MGREIATLQFGKEANYLSTHFWNTQNKPSFTPRSLIFDLKENVGSVISNQSNTEINSHEDVLSPEENCSDNFLLIKKTPNPRNSFFYDPKNNPLSYQDVHFWSDFNLLNYHPDSLHPVSGLETGSSLGLLDSFNNGLSIFDSYQKSESVLDNEFRAILEKSDDLQGIQLMSDSYGGFAGLSSAFIEYLSSELEKKSILLFSVSKTDSKSWENSQMCDAALSLIYTLDFQTPVIHLNAPNLNSWLSSPYLKDTNPMHRFNTSAVQSIVLDTITFPILSGDSDLSSFINYSSFGGQYNLLSPRLQLGNSFELPFENSIMFNGFLDKEALLNQSLDFSPIKYSYPLSFPIEFDSGSCYLGEKSDIDLSCDISSYRQSTSFLIELNSSITKSIPFKNLHGDDQVEAWSEQILNESEKYN
ncbi:Protein DML1 [Smittium culicis]|uniref:Protein DML1 n=1 Tax=Smittium culicis TaxID=133412 RepID=A0A1R1XYL4_9FUNG|nr:Protein DML1 [Smittium culicis]